MRIGLSLSGLGTAVGGAFGGLPPSFFSVDAIVASFVIATASLSCLPG